MSNNLEDELISKGFFGKVLGLAFNIPGFRVDRKDFLRKELLALYFDNDKIMEIIEKGTVKSGVDLETMNKMANGSIKFHTKIATLMSSAAGAPGFPWIIATIPTDLAQYLYQVVVLAQKLAFIYGSQDIADNTGDEFKSHILILLGVAFGAKGANELLVKILPTLAKDLSKRTIVKLSSKIGLYQAVREVYILLGKNLTQKVFKSSVSKFLPIIGSVLSGGVTYVTFSHSVKRLQKSLIENIGLLKE